MASNDIDSAAPALDVHVKLDVAYVNWRYCDTDSIQKKVAELLGVALDEVGVLDVMDTEGRVCVNLRSCRLPKAIIANKAEVEQKEKDLSSILEQYISSMNSGPTKSPEVNMVGCTTCFVGCPCDCFW